jgi:hypothetical protein
MFTTALILFAISSSPTLEPIAAPSAGDHGVVWFEGGYNKALRKARADDSLVFIAFVPDTSTYSTKVLEETLPDATVGAELADLICLRFDNENDARFEQLRRTFNVETYPTFVVTNARGKIEDRIEGFIPVEPMVQQMQRIKSAEGTVSWHRAQVEEEPDNLEHQYSLAQMLDGVKDYKTAGKTYDGIRRADPEGHTAPGMRLILSETWNQVAEAGGDDRANWDLEPIRQRLSGASDEAAFEGWNGIGNFYAGIDGKLGDSIDAFMVAWKSVPESNTRSWAKGVASFIVENGEDDLDMKHQRFALELAARAVEEARRDRDEHVAEYGTSESEDGGDYDSWLASHIDVLVWCQMAFGDHDQAVASCRKTLELDPENAEFQGRLAMLLAQG